MVFGLAATPLLLALLLSRLYCAIWFNGEMVCFVHVCIVFLYFILFQCFFFVRFSLISNTLQWLMLLYYIRSLDGLCGCSLVATATILSIDQKKIVYLYTYRGRTKENWMFSTFLLKLFSLYIKFSKNDFLWMFFGGVAWWCWRILFESLDFDAFVWISLRCVSCLLSLMIYGVCAPFL